LELGQRSVRVKGELAGRVRMVCEAAMDEAFER
jgi:hypothetical protein